MGAPHSVVLQAPHGQRAAPLMKVIDQERHHPSQQDSAPTERYGHDANK